VNAIAVTNLSACSGGISWLIAEKISGDKHVYSLKGVAFGVISGLVGSTPLAGFVDVQAAMLIGLISGIIGYLGVSKLSKTYLRKYDDALDVFAIHGLVGTWGSLATGIFSDEKLSGRPGMIYGDYK